MIRSIINIWHFSQKQHGIFIKSIVFSFLNGMFTMAQMFAIFMGIRCLLGEAPVRDTVITIVIAAVICVLGSFITSYISQISIIKTGMYMTENKRITLGDILRNVHLGFFSNFSVGRVVATMTSTLSSIELQAPSLLLYVIGGLFSAISIVLAMLFFEWHTGMIILIGMGIYLLTVAWEMNISRAYAPRRQEAQSTLADSAISFLQGMKVTKSFSFQSGDESLKKGINGSCAQNLYLTDKSMFSQIISQLCIVLFEVLMIADTLYLYHAGTITLSVTLSLIVMSFMAFSSLMQTGGFLSMIGMLDSAMSEADQLEQTKQQTHQYPIEQIKSSEIEFDHVSFGYDGREILHNISVVIRPNTKTAIIGPSGSGKSTLCNLVPRFWDITSGSIRVGGADIRHVEMPELMRHISFVFQDNYLFEDTVMNNIRFGRPRATEEEVKAAARAARCDEFIQGLSDGYNTIVSESGSSISGGEKQRIAIARAILKDAPIIILDEATSALDSENERAVMAAIDALTQNKTVIMVAHRMKIVSNADHIIAMEDGCIAEEGTHEELIKKNGIYSRFVQDRTAAQQWKIR